jgi:hypothetical protein
LLNPLRTESQQHDFLGLRRTPEGRKQPNNNGPAIESRAVVFASFSYLVVRVELDLLERRDYFLAQ